MRPQTVQVAGVVGLLLTLLDLSTRRNKAKHFPEVVIAVEVVAINPCGTVICTLCARPHAKCPVGSVF